MKKKIFGIVLCLMLLITMVGCGKVEPKDNENNNNNNNNDNTQEEQNNEKKLSIIDVNSKTRPYAVMINNIAEARPTAGLQDAYLVYEIVVEGGITRYLALFKDVDVAKIGSVRSSRHYYLDYAMENDAIYTHFGWSYVAEQQIPELGINNVNGYTTEANAFWRDTTLNRAYEHTAFTSTAKIAEAVKNRGYRTETNKDLLLNYSVDEIDLSAMSDAKSATNISIVYSGYQTASYEYDATNKVYVRSSGGKVDTDLTSKENITVKNIITYQVEDVSYNGDAKLRDLKNIGSGTGYYITNGYAVPITWEKTARDAQTVYKYQDGTEITVNDGNTFIQIQPKGKKLTIQ